MSGVTTLVDLSFPSEGWIEPGRRVRAAAHPGADVSQRALVHQERLRGRVRPRRGGRPQVHGCGAGGGRCGGQASERPARRPHLPGADRYLHGGADPRRDRGGGRARHANPDPRAHSRSASSRRSCAARGSRRVQWLDKLGYLGPAPPSATASSSITIRGCAGRRAPTSPVSRRPAPRSPIARPCSRAAA